MRVFLFLTTNIAILLVLSLITKLLGIDQYLTANGINYTQLLIFSAVIGFGGSFISLMLSKKIAKKSMRVHIIETPKSEEERWLLSTVKHYAEESNIGMPEVGIFNTPEPNAFATGARKNSSLVAVSTGLLKHMSRSEVEAVIGHEIAHVSNGDMVTLTLIQGVLNTFVFFLSRVIGSILDSAMRGQRGGGGRGFGYFIMVMISQVVLGVLASIVVMWFSRRREFVADRGGAKLAGRKNMIAALEKLQSFSQRREPEGLPERMAAFGIGGKKKRPLSFLSTHPPLEDRIEALKQADFTQAVR